MSNSVEEGDEDTSKEEIKKSHIEIIAAQYGLPDLEFVGVSGKGISSYNAILETPDGRRFFVKQYKKDDAERRANSNLVERYLAEHSSVPVVVPLETLQGASSVYLDDKMYALFIYRDHTEGLPDSPEKKSKRIYELAKTLGSIHSVSVMDTLLTVKEIDRWKQRTSEDRVKHLEKIEAFIESKETQDGFDITALAVIQERKTMLEKSSDLNTTPVANTVCHGDYHSQNVLFGDDMNVIGVCDWDICGLSDPYVDFLNSFKVTVIGKKYDTYEEERYDAARIFIQGYRSGINFHFDMSRLQNAIHTLSQVVIGSSWPLEEHYFMNYTKADGYLEKEIEKARFFNENSAKIYEFITRVVTETV